MGGEDETVDEGSTAMMWCELILEAIFICASVGWQAQGGSQDPGQERQGGGLGYISLIIYVSTGSGRVREQICGWSEV